MFQSLLHLFRLSFSNAYFADVTMRKLKYIKRSWPFRCYLKNGHRHGKAFPTLKFIENEQKLWYLKGKKSILHLEEPQFG